MRGLPIHICLAVLFVFSWGCEKKQITPQSRAQDERTIRDIERSVSEAIAAKDLDRLVSLYADDAGLYDEHRPTIRGRSAIREAWRTTFARPELVIMTEPRNTEISEDGEIGWGSGLLSMTLNRNAGKPVTQRWEYALVYMRAPGGWKIMADSIHSGIRKHLSREPVKARPALASLAPLIGITCFLAGIWFLFGMPVVFLTQTWKLIRSRKLSAGFLVSAAMLVAFFVTAALLWGYFTTHEWNLPFWAALRAAGDSARYGNPVEDTAEDILVALLTFSTAAAVIAGALVGVGKRVFLPRRDYKPAA